MFLPLGFRQLVVSQTCLSVIWKYIYIDRILKNYISLSDKKSNRSHLEPIVSRQKIFNILRFMSFIDHREAPLIQFCFVLEIYTKLDFFQNCLKCRILVEKEHQFLTLVAIRHLLIYNSHFILVISRKNENASIWNIKRFCENIRD